MNWLKARLTEPSTWSAMSSVLLAIGLYLSASVSWWRVPIYISAGCAVIAAIKKESGGT